MLGIPINQAWSPENTMLSSPPKPTTSSYTRPVVNQPAIPLSPPHQKQTERGFQQPYAHQNVREHMASGHTTPHHTTDPNIDKIVYLQHMIDQMKQQMNVLYTAKVNAEKQLQESSPWMTYAGIFLFIVLFIIVILLLQVSKKLNQLLGSGTSLDNFPY